MKYLLLSALLFVGCKEQKKDEKVRIPGTNDSCYVIGDFPDSLNWWWDGIQTSKSGSITHPDRYFIVFYYSKNNRMHFIGNMGSTTTMGDMFNPEEFIRDVDISNKKYGVLQTSITGIMEVNKQDFESYWKNR